MPSVIAYLAVLKRLFENIKETTGGKEALGPLLGTARAVFREGT